MTRLQVFARAPRPGQTKTRLIPALGPQGAAVLHAAMIYRSLETALSAGLGEVELWCADHPDDPFMEECARRFQVTLRQQQGSDLGQRMFNALKDARQAGHHALLMGTDCPALSGAHLRQASHWLDQGAGLVLGPAEDGGYVLIGAGRLEEGLFTDMPWGTDAVLHETLTRAARLELAVKTLPPLPDMDRPEDLVRLGLFDVPSP